MQQLTYRLQRSLRAAVVTVFLGLLLIFAGPLFAQTDNGRISGTVTDATGAAIPAAQVTVTNLATNATQKTKSNGGGEFSMAALQPGPYKASVTAQGFQRQDTTFKLDVSQVQAINFKLQVGSEGTTLEVTGAAPIVDSTTSSTGIVIQDRELSDLPLNGRNFTQLALLAPGITRGQVANSASGYTAGHQQPVETMRYNDTGGRQSFGQRAPSAGEQLPARRPG